MKVSKKICILGDFAVGKTSLVRRYVLNEFSPDYQATLGVNIYKYSDDVSGPSGDEPVTVNQVLWDIEGADDEKKTVLDTYLHGAAGALVVGDVTRDGTVQSMFEHARHFQHVQVGRPVVFALNKVDLLDKTDVQEQRRSALESEFGSLVLETSAATGAAVRDLFRSLAMRVLELGT